MIEINSSYELLGKLKNLGGYNKGGELMWWPGAGTFRIVVETVLVQQTKWQKVQNAMQNLKEADLIDLQKIADTDTKTLSELIKPSGFYNTKAKRLKLLCNNILRDFGDFENFKLQVDREWLLAQKGLGKESSDCILNYVCFADVMVSDSYTHRLLSALGYELDEYDEIASWLRAGINENIDKVHELYGEELPLHVIYARFHGKIVEFCAKNMRGKKVDLGLLV